MADRFLYTPEIWVEDDGRAVGMQLRVELDANYGLDFLNELPVSGPIAPRVMTALADRELFGEIVRFVARDS